MEPERPQKPAPEPLLAAWIKWTMDFWEDLAHMGPGLTGRGAALDQAGTETPCLAALNLWQAFFSLLGEPGTVAAVFEGIKAPSEIILKMAQTGWRGYFYLHQQWVEILELETLPGEPSGFENLDQEIFKICTEFYEKDFRELLNLPQITRLSQGRLNQAMDRFGQFRNAMAEFVYLLFLPLKKSLRDMRGVLEDEGRPIEDFKDYYRKWLRVLEGHYMTLFKSPGFIRTMSHTLNALEDFYLAKQALMSEALAALSIPSHLDLDELYREMYLLKKQVKSLSKKLADASPTA